MSGLALASALPASLVARLEATPGPAGVEGHCWMWSGALNDGYGYVAVGRRWLRVHRVVYEHVHGPVPDGLVLDHLCENKACANPAHLEPVTQRVNIQRARMLTHCKRGHVLSVHRYVSPTGKGSYCRACKRVRRNEKGSA